MKVGVLALQGGYNAHVKQLERCGVKTRLVTLPEHLNDIQGLVIPGGESTALLKLMAPHQFLKAISVFVKQGGGLMATCAGMILAAQQVLPEQESLALIDIDVVRNAYGRQQDSHIVTGLLDANFFTPPSFEMVFIRAPRISRVGPDAKILAREDIAGTLQPVMVQQGLVLALAFHPELGTDLRIHQYFLKKLQSN